MRFALISFLLALLGIKTAYANVAEPVVVPADLKRIELLPALEIALGSPSNLSLGDAMALHFFPLHGPRMGIPNADEAIWVRGRLVNVGEDSIATVIDTGDHAVDYVDFFAVDADSGNVLSHELSGSARPFAVRALGTKGIAFPLALPPHRAVDIYLRVQSRTRVQIAPVLYSTTVFQEVTHWHDVVTYMFYGGLVALILYHLIETLYSREWESSYFVVFLIIWGLYGALLEGLLFPLFPSRVSLLYHSSYAVAATIFPIATIALLTEKYLNVARRFPRFFRFYIGNLIAITLVSLCVIAEWLQFPHLRLAMMVFMISMLLANVLVWGVCAYHEPGAVRFYFVGFAMMLLFLLNTVRISLVSSGFYTDSDFWLRLSYIAPLLLFAAGHGQRISQLRLMNRESAQRVAHAVEQMEFKSSFLATMSHEIRTPMNGVVGPVELLRLTPLSDEQTKYVNIISTASRALLDVVNDILDYSKLQAGKLALEVANFSLREMLGSCNSIFSSHPKSAVVQFSIEVDEDVPDNMAGDVHRLRQVLLNLIGNALKFTEKGSVRLLVRVTGRHSRDVHLIEFLVIDSGVGISASDQENLFSEYQQVGSAHAGKVAGTGLGLAICKQLVELMHGSISISSEPGVGSTFRFEIPLATVN